MVGRIESMRCEEQIAKYGYRLIRPLGGGTCGKVWEAEDEQGTVVAVKVIQASQLPAPLFRSHVQQFQQLKGLRHPRLVRVQQLRITSEVIVVEMERADCNFLELQNIYQRETGGAIPPQDFLDLLQPIAIALDELVSVKKSESLMPLKITPHCGIHPANLLIVGDDVKISDFGLCFSQHQFISSYPDKSHRIFVAPELYGKRHTRATDQYALAILFCRLCLGDRCFTGEWDNSAEWKPLLNSRKLREAEFPVLKKALEPDWTQRWPSCQAFFDALRKAAKAPRRRKINRVWQ